MPGTHPRTHHHAHPPARRCVALLLLALVAVVLAPLSARADEREGAVDPVWVFYPRGDCQTGIIEVQVFERGERDWVPHPEHPHVRGDTCQVEDAGRLLQEIRIRCVDPEVPGRVSDWRVGADVFRPRPAPQCGPLGPPEHHPSAGAG